MILYSFFLRMIMETKGLSQTHFREIFYINFLQKELRRGRSLQDELLTFT